MVRSVKKIMTAKEINTIAIKGQDSALEIIQTELIEVHELCTEEHEEVLNEVLKKLIEKLQMMIN